jgi:hypothetical protein
MIHRAEVVCENILNIPASISRAKVTSTHHTDACELAFLYFIYMQIIMWFASEHTLVIFVFEVTSMQTSVRIYSHSIKILETFRQIFQFSAKKLHLVQSVCEPLTDIVKQKVVMSIFSEFHIRQSTATSRTQSQLREKPEQRHYKCFLICD